VVEPHPALRRLLGDDRLRQQAQAGAAELARNRDAPEPERARLRLEPLAHLAREGIRVVVELRLLRANVLTHEGPDGLAKEL
jgi:hypothetical protein